MATPVKWGNEFIVNTIADGSQTGPVAVGLGNGQFAVSYTDASGSLEFGTDTSGSAVRLEVFNADGSHAGDPVQINTVTANGQSGPNAALMADGGLAVVFNDWSQGADSANDDGSGGATRLQIVSADGTASGSETLVNGVITSNQLEPDVAVLGNGRIVVVYADESQGSETANDDTALQAIRGKVLNADGTTFVTDFLVNTITAGAQSEPAVTALNGGNRFVVTWRDTSASADDPSGAAIRGQIFTGDGTRVGGEFLVNSVTTGDQAAPQVVGLTGGGFAVVYTDYSTGADSAGDDPSMGASRAEVFDETGTRVAGGILVNTVTTGNQIDPSIAALSGGGFVVAYEERNGGSDGDGKAICLQAFNSNGSRDGTEIVVNTTVADDQYAPSVDALGDGRFVVSYADSSFPPYPIRAQIFDTRSEAVNIRGDVTDEQFAGTRFGDTIRGKGGNDMLFGERGKDELLGNVGRDTIDGGSGRDTIKGGGGRDVLDGGAGRDLLTGGKAADTFEFANATDSKSRVRARDHITDFNPGRDIIDLSEIDANTSQFAPGDDPFTWIRKAEFSGAYGELRYEKRHGITLVQGDTDGDGVADFEIQLDDRLPLHASDFIL